MNLHVDLMDESERRSGRAVRGKFLAVATGATAAVLLLMMLAGLVWAHHDSVRERADVERDKQAIEPDYRRVVALGRDLKAAEALAGALSRWRDTRLDAYRLTRALQRAVPETIQLTQLLLDEKLDPAPAGFGRTAGMFLRGKVAGPRPDEAVRRLADALTGDVFFATSIADAQVKRFAASEAPAEADVRLFEIECQFRARPLGEPAVVPAAPGAP